MERLQDGGGEEEDANQMRPGRISSGSISISTSISTSISGSGSGSSIIIKNPSPLARLPKEPEQALMLEDAAAVGSESPQGSSVSSSAQSRSNATTNSSTAGRSASSTSETAMGFPRSGSEQSEESAWSTISRQSRPSASSTTASRPSRLFSAPPSARPPFWWLPSSTGTPSLSRYDGIGEGEEGEEGGGRGGGGLLSSSSLEEEDSAAALGKGVRMRRVIQSVMHGVVLALQSLVALAVLSVFVWITLWKTEDSEPAFWAWLWEIPSPALGSVLILCFATMVIHEVRVLSAVALLYLQAAILALTTVTVVAMWASCVGQESSVVKAILVGCSVFMWGMAALGFLRAAVVWRFDSLQEEEVIRGRFLRGDGEAYGTF